MTAPSSSEPTGQVAAPDLRLPGGSSPAPALAFVAATTLLLTATVVGFALALGQEGGVLVHASLSVLGAVTLVGILGRVLRRYLTGWHLEGETLHTGLVSLPLDEVVGYAVTTTRDRSDPRALHRLVIECQVDGHERTFSSPVQASDHTIERIAARLPYAARVR